MDEASYSQEYTIDEKIDELVRLGNLSRVEARKLLSTVGGDIIDLLDQFADMHKLTALRMVVDYVADNDKMTEFKIKKDDMNAFNSAIGYTSHNEFEV